jgi:NAD(P)-dependent dehydrogenase (short-subunit alcohol dehydrogenase family)
MSKRLNGKVAVITGATSGMALAAAKRFVQEGAYVFITGRRQEQLDAAVAAIGGNVTGVRADSGRLAEIDRLYDVVRQTKGKLDIVYANAGAFSAAPIGEITEDHFDGIFDLNVRGTLFTVQKALPLLVDGGSVILTGSIASIKGFAALSAYNASKAALRSFARTWLVDLKARGIRVNVLSPGPVETGVFTDVPKEAKDAFVQLIPRGTIGQPEELANAALFLASDEASFVNGIELYVDGGTAQI